MIGSMHVWCTFSLIGFHAYPNAPAQVAYLADRHRHEFKFRVSLQVTDDNREVEFHTLRNFCISVIRNAYAGDERGIAFGARSCEMIAKDLLAVLSNNAIYGNRGISIEVSEDGECGATVLGR